MRRLTIVVKRFTLLPIILGMFAHQIERGLLVNTLTLSRLINLGVLVVERSFLGSDFLGFIKTILSDASSFDKTIPFIRTRGLITSSDLMPF